MKNSKVMEAIIIMRFTTNKVEGSCVLLAAVLEP